MRAEGLCVLIVSLLAYAQFGAGWLLFALLFFTPDISFLGYLAGPGVGGALYNAVHSYVGSLLLLGVGIVAGTSIVSAVGIIWIAHIGFDRALGYGLKYSTGFHVTHLGAIGRRPLNTASGKYGHD